MLRFLSTMTAPRRATPAVSGPHAQLTLALHDPDAADQIRASLSGGRRRPGAVRAAPALRHRSEARSRSPGVADVATHGAAPVPAAALGPNRFRLPNEGVMCNLRPMLLTLLERNARPPTCCTRWPREHGGCQRQSQFLDLGRK
jgi:hypothetical protein